MQASTLLKSGVIGAMTTLALSISSWAHAQQEWKFQINVNAGDDQYKIAQQWAEDVAQRSNGEITIELLPSSAIVGNNETLDAVGAGILQGHITDPSYFAGKNPAFAVYGNMVGAWSDPYQFLGYMRNAGGEDRYNALVEPYNVHLIRAGAMIPEALVSKRKIETMEDFKGLKIRAPEGMVSNIFQLAGAAPVNLPTSEVYTALEKGVIDAADYTVFATNYTQGYHRFAPYAIYPGFHSMPMMAVSLNKDIWDELSPDDQQMLRDSIDDFVDHLYQQLTEADQEQVEIAKQDGVKFSTLSPDELKKFRATAQSEWENWRDKSPQAKEAVDSMIQYLKDQDLL
ncbi:C4-dicarboxylate ABC transporter substrate-binding protein [Terasakiispira papahanaumokuakeensis]|uniref:C4-dicarboxylate ABC transporter substrate-binding protein n=1 Tax=Terasakiispira papahanaumokuakeensis TaxID=197479 RepID=A0A1E2V8E3_9GAMM|nr:TRAP transporter substrate-binding protein [Terasakiispira papahanaumokuakeensis]ODC03251.1 C4-dicarboxylate ABC transporter substrate-binding protein [Terasakiispira papahanaumokuakeensis]